MSEAFTRHDEIDSGLSLLMRNPCRFKGGVS